MENGGAMRSHRQLVEAAMASLSRVHRSMRKPPAFWGRVADHFAVGSTSAKEICREFGYDQDTGERDREPAGLADGFQEMSRRDKYVANALQASEDGDVPALDRALDKIGRADAKFDNDPKGSKR
jgi:uroporphyrinogen-III synthase